MRACQYHDNINHIQSMTCHHVSQCQSWSWLKQSPCQSSAWTKPASAWASTHSWQRKPTSGDFGLGELMMMIVIIMREKPVQLPMLWNWLDNCGLCLLWLHNHRIVIKFTQVTHRCHNFRDGPMLSDCWPWTNLLRAVSRSKSGTWCRWTLINFLVLNHLKTYHDYCASQVIEPQFQRDFISLLPKELAL